MVHFHNVLDRVQQSHLDRGVLFFEKTLKERQKVLFPPVSSHHTENIGNGASARHPNTVSSVREQTHIQRKKTIRTQTMSTTRPTCLDSASTRTPRIVPAAVAMASRTYMEPVVHPDSPSAQIKITCDDESFEEFVAVEDSVIVEDAEELDAVRRLLHQLFKEWFRKVFVDSHESDDEWEKRLTELCGPFLDEWLQSGENGVEKGGFR